MGKFKLIFILIIMHIGFMVFSQNLVPDGAFKNYVNCPIAPGELKSNYWWNPSRSSPDLFNECSNNITDFITGRIGKVGVPNNYMGYCLPYVGSGYVGIITLSSTTKDEKIRRVSIGNSRVDSRYLYQEYIQCKLLEPMIKGNKYRITTYIYLADSSKFWNDRISFAFTKDSLLLYSKGTEGLNSMLNCPDSSLITIVSNTLFNQYGKWVKLTTEYISKGGEYYFTIGVFMESITPKQYKRIIRCNKLIKRDRLDGNYAYYYLDNISIVML